MGLRRQVFKKQQEKEEGVWRPEEAEWETPEDGFKGYKVLKRKSREGGYLGNFYFAAAEFVEFDL